jgi:hypothetical protein
MSRTTLPSPRYHTRIQKGGALLTEMRLLTRCWRGDMTADQTAATRRILGKKTLARSRDTFTRSFVPRFLHGDPPQAWRIVRCLEDRNADPEGDQHHKPYESVSSRPDLFAKFNQAGPSPPWLNLPTML